MSVIGTIIECVNCRARTLSDGAQISYASCHDALQRDIRELRAENARMRNALRTIAAVKASGQDLLSLVWFMRDTAIDADFGSEHASSPRVSEDKSR